MLLTIFQENKGIVGVGPLFKPGVVLWSADDMQNNGVLECSNVDDSRII